MILLTNKSLKPASFQKKLLAWFDKHGRKTLPWQQNKTPYRVWVSEIMLQQTQVNTVIPYFIRFIEHFPTVETLAAATEDDVLHYWTGLGYYSRARNLHKAAKMVVEHYQAQFPCEVDELEKLPGVGRSTAGAIRASAFEKTATILDGNVKRVLTRFHAIEEWPGNSKMMDHLWALAEYYTPQLRIADYTQAIMDLGATICVRGKPLCEQCPLAKHCVALSKGIEKKLPLPKPRKLIPTRKSTLLIIRKAQTILLEKRPSTGIWGGLWSLPEIEGHALSQEIEKRCLKHFSIQSIEREDIFRHSFSHYHLDILPVIVTISKVKIKTMEGMPQIWYNLQEPAVIGLPAPVKFLLSRLSS